MRPGHIVAEQGPLRAAKDLEQEFGLNLIIAGFATVLAERIVGKTAEPL